MSRNTLLLAVATAALITGTGGAYAQQELNRNTGVEKEKSAPSAVSKPSPGATQQNRKEQGSQAGQNRTEATGQAPGSNAGGKQPAEEHKAGESKAGEKAGGVKAGEKAVEKKAGPAVRERQTTGQNERPDRGDRERSTTGQSTPSERRDTDRPNRNDRRDNADRDRNQGDRDRVQGERNENRTTITEGREGRSTTNVNVELRPEQRTRIHEVILRERSAPRVTNVNFSLTIGTPVPRSMRLVRLPSTIIEIEPSWRGFEYFLVGDEIVVVDPRTMEIVAVISA